MAIAASTRPRIALAHPGGPLEDTAKLLLRLSLGALMLLHGINKVTGGIDPIQRRLGPRASGVLPGDGAGHCAAGRGPLQRQWARWPLELTRWTARVHLELNQRPSRGRAYHGSIHSPALCRHRPCSAAFDDIDHDRPGQATIGGSIAGMQFAAVGVLRRNRGQC